jgi:hypothetical protein
MTDIDSEYIYDDINPNFNIVYYCHYELENNLFCNKFSPDYDCYCDDHFKDKILSDKYHDINVHKKYLITEIKKLLSEISFSKTKLQRINIITTTYKLLCDNRWILGTSDKLYNAVINKLFEIKEELSKDQEFVNEIQYFNECEKLLMPDDNFDHVNKKDIISSDVNEVSEKNDVLDSDQNLNEKHNICKVQLNLYYATWCLHSQKFLPTWKKFVNELTNEYDISEISINEFTEIDKITSDHEIFCFPTIRLIFDSTQTQIDFVNKRTIKNLYKFLKESLNNNNIELQKIKNNKKNKANEKHNENQDFSVELSDLSHMKAKDIYIDI